MSAAGGWQPSALEQERMAYRRRQATRSAVIAMVSTLRELRSDGMTMVLATHEMAFAAQVADTVCFLSGGRILEQGPPDAIFNHPQHQATRDFLAKLHFDP